MMKLVTTSVYAHMNPMLQSFRRLGYLKGTLTDTVQTYTRFQVLTAASMRIRAFWNLAPCSLVGVDRRFRDAYYFHHQGIVDDLKENISNEVV
jgi:hypothetical protein